MRMKQIIFSSIFFLTLATGLKAGGVKVDISASDTMKYNVTKIEAHPGEHVVVRLTNVGNLPKEAMGHNWVLLEAGVNPGAYAKLALTAKADNYQPRNLANKVIASIRILGPKESGSVSFTAPSAPGSYPYLCSFPAHFGAGMAGVLIVK